MKKIIGILIFTILSISMGCDEEPCKGEPIIIEIYETFRLKIVNQNDVDIFSEDFGIDSLNIVENNSTLNLTRSDYGVIEFQLSNETNESLKQNYGESKKIEVLINLNSSISDTLQFVVKPVEYYVEKCRMTKYESVAVYFNSTLLYFSGDTYCIFCCSSELEYLTIKRR